MTVNTCRVCGSATPDGTVCVTETERARRQLAEIWNLVEPARAVMYRQTATGDSGHARPGPRDLLDYGAGARLDAVQTALTGWARDLSDDQWRPEPGEVITQAAAWLAERVEVIRHVQQADDILREIWDCLMAMRSVVATPAGRVYLGTCGAAWTDWNPDGTPLEAGYCDGDVYGKPGKAASYCQTCGAAYDQDERRLQVTRLVDGKGFRASVIAHAYGISANTIRGWAWVRRNDKGEPINDPKLKPVGRDERNRPLYLVADVLALAAAADQRREQRTAQAAGMGA